MSILKRSFSRRKPEPINLSAAGAQSSDDFFDALLKSCATPATPVRTSFSGYASTPEPLGYPEPRSLHRKPSATPAVPESKYYRTSDGLERELRSLKEPASTPEWPTRSSSIKGSQRYVNIYRHLIQHDQKRKHPPSSLASVETNEEQVIEDGYDHYSEKRHEVLRNRGFWPRLRRDHGEPSPMHRSRRTGGHARGPRQDCDMRPPSSKREDAFVMSPSPVANPQNSFDLRRSVLFEPERAPKPVVQSISVSLSATPSTIGLVPRPLFSLDQPPSRWSLSDSDVDSTSLCESDYSLPFEDTSIFCPRAGAAETPITPLSPWPHSYPLDQPEFTGAELEECRLSNPSLLHNIGQPLPDKPYLHLSWSTLSLHEYLLALGYHALTQGLELPLVYAARSNAGRDWAEEEGVAKEVEKFNGRVEEMCMVELKTIERMNDRDEKLEKEFGLDKAWTRRDDEERPDYSIRMPSEDIICSTSERMRMTREADAEVKMEFEAQRTTQERVRGA